MASYTLKLENDRLMEISEFVEFCQTNQGQSITIQVNNEGHCLDFCGVYRILDLFEFESVKILTCNAIESHFKYRIENKNWFLWLQHHYDLDSKKDYPWNYKKIFGCFFQRPSAPRLGIAAHLCAYHKKRSLIVSKFSFQHEDLRKQFDLERLFTWHPRSLENLLLFQKDLDSATQDPVDHVPFTATPDWVNTAMNLSDHYKDIMIDVVSEPSCSGRAFYPTEKIARAMLCRRPFIVMANRNYLAYLRQIGFKTFNDFWNEDYDGVDQNLRYLKISDLIDDISNLGHDTLEKMYHDMAPMLEHNYNVLIDKSFSTQVMEIDDGF